jgi:sodium-dependent dicarboxylate transporter 2/3/5
MVPFVLGVIEHAEAEAETRAATRSGAGDDPVAAASAVRGYGRGLLIGVAWAATIGGSATLIGTTGPAILATYYAEHYPDALVPLNFGTWSSFAVGISLVLFLVAYVGLSAVFCCSKYLSDLSRTVLQGELAALGSLRPDERVVASALLFQIVFWFLRGIVLVPFIGNCRATSESNVADEVSYAAAVAAASTREVCLSSGGTWSSPFTAYDAGIACAGAIVLFISPSSDRPGERILEWAYVNSKMPWDILLLLGGGFAVSKGFVGERRIKGSRLSSVRQPPLF